MSKNFIKQRNKNIKKNRKIMENAPKLVGVLEKHPMGFGFVRQEEGGDIFIGRSNMNGAMNKDLVEVDLLPEYLWTRSKEGIIDKVLERNTTELVGVFQKNKRFGFVVSDDPRNNDDIFISQSNFRNAQNGDTVVAKITKYPDKSTSAEGKITEIISRYGEKGGQIKAIVRANGLYETFPSRANAEAKAMSKLPITKEDIANRRDLRHKTIITIDGATSKDFDDAVSVEKLENGNYLLGVHIADVTHYVEEDGNLDKEALKRGNSVYLLNTVVPMLPKVMSNGICSLNPDVDRLTLTCQMEIDSFGTVVDHDIFESVIHSKARMIYDDVSDILEKHDEMLIEKYRFIYDDLLLMQELSLLIRQKREAKGSLDFDIDEAAIMLDDDEVPIEIGLEERRIANKLIEDFMLCANETIAEHFYWMEYPFIYRIHEKPEPSKLMELKAFLGKLGFNLAGNPDSIHPKALSDILTASKGTKYENIVNESILRSMKKAVYDTTCMGHFGLSFTYYCHFTSPIRRYPDLFIHRIIKASIKGELDEAKLDELKTKAAYAAEVSSATEKNAKELERKVEKIKKAEYMLNHIGEIHQGVISGVSDFGIYVQLPNTVEGLVRLESIRDDYYDVEKDNYRIIGRETRNIYSLGDVVTIEVINADAKQGYIDFELTDEIEVSEITQKES